MTGPSRNAPSAHRLTSLHLLTPFRARAEREKKDGGSQDYVRANTAYQRHLQDVYNKMLELLQEPDPACDALRAEVADEMRTHEIKFTGPRGEPSRHTGGDPLHPLGEAIDIAKDFGLPTTGSGSIDNLGTGCGLKRLINKRLRRKDPGHLSLDGQ